MSECPGGQCSGVLTVPDAKLWWPIGHGAARKPFLYTLAVSLGTGGNRTSLATTTDVYRQLVGIRTVTVGKAAGAAAVFVNGRSHYFRGMNLQVDAPLRGRKA